MNQLKIYTQISSMIILLQEVDRPKHLAFLLEKVNTMELL